MKSINTLLPEIGSGAYDKKLGLLYGEENIALQRKRYIRALNEFENEFGTDRNVNIFSVPGRVEIGGNHTDHQGGHVLAASTDMDIIGIASPNNDGIIRIKSEGFPIIEVVVAAEVVPNGEYSPLGDMIIADLDPYPDEIGESIALVRGVAGGYYLRGIQPSGFDCYTTSDITVGVGLSSSAAFEVLIASIMNVLYTDNTTPKSEIAEISQFAENVYYGKPCGLTGQLTTAVGGIISIDFYDKDEPMIDNVNYNFTESGYSVCIIECGSSHSHTPEFSAIPREMTDVANFFGKPILSRVDSRDFFTYMDDVRKRCGDRAVLRALHFFEEDKRALQEAKHLKNGDFKSFLKEIKKSGRSSYMYLQNIYAANDSLNQPLAIALAKCDMVLGDKGAFRVHGGGFGGTIQAFVPDDIIYEFKNEIEELLGENTCHVLKIGRPGSTEITEE